MPSRHQLNAMARALGFDPSTIANDSKLEQKVIYLMNNATAITGTAAASTLTSDNTNNSDGDTVVIGSYTYTFKTTLGTAPYQILIGASADASLTNLVNALSGGGTPGTDYTQATPKNTLVSGAAVSSHATVITARDTNVGKGLATTTTATHLSWTGSTLESGTAQVAGVIAKANSFVRDMDSGLAGGANTSI